MRQRGLETVNRRLASRHLSGVTPGVTGMSGHGTTRRTLRFAAGPCAYDELGRVTLPHASLRPAGITVG